MYERLKSTVNKVEIVDCTVANTSLICWWLLVIDVEDEYISPQSVEVNYITANSCQFLLHFTAEAKLDDLTGIIITNINEESKQSSLPHEEDYFYSPQEYKVIPVEDHTGKDLIISHKALIANTCYSFKICAVYKDIRSTTPVYVNNITTRDTEKIQTLQPITDFEGEESCCHCCCCCNLFENEDSIDLRHSELTILSIQEEKREIVIASHKKSLSCVIPLNSICNTYFIKQGEMEGLVVLVIKFLILHL